MSKNANLVDDPGGDEANGHSGDVDDDDVQVDGGHRGAEVDCDQGGHRGKAVEVRYLRKPKKALHFYRVSNLLVHLGWFDFNSGVSPPCIGAQVHPPNSHRPS